MAMNSSSGRRIELIYSAYVVLLIGVATWRNWSSPILTLVYVVSAAILLAMLIRSRKIDTLEAYSALGKVAFAIFIVDSFITLMRLR